jgi:hypothetical protein
MRGVSDTSPEAERVLIECYRRMTPARKWQILGDAYRFARVLHASGVRRRIANANAADIHRDWFRLHFSDAPWWVRAGETDMQSQPIEHQRVILEVMSAFERLGIACAVGGSLASSVHGVPRYTQDADVTAAPFPGKEAALVGQFGSDYYVDLGAVSQAVRGRSSFNIIHLPSGFKVDVFIQKARPFDQNLLQRSVPRTDLDPAGHPIAVLSPEDIILHKLEWYRLGGEISDRQWNDLLGVLKVLAGRLDDAYLDQWAANLGVSDLLVRARQEAPSLP